MKQAEGGGICCQRNKRSCQQRLAQSNISKRKAVAVKRGASAGESVAIESAIAHQRASARQRECGAAQIGAVISARPAVASSFTIFVAAAIA